MVARAGAAGNGARSDAGRHAASHRSLEAEED
jgi:hypothetical protein